MLYNVSNLLSYRGRVDPAQGGDGYVDVLRVAGVQARGLGGPPRRARHRHTRGRGRRGGQRGGE